MIKRVAALCILACLSGAALAGGDATVGKALVTACAACHGADGNSASGDFPRLAGQGERYLTKQLKQIQCSTKTAEEQAQARCTPRSAPLMASLLTGLSEQNLSDIAAYYASQKAGIAGAANSAEAPLALGEQVYRAGIREKSVAACTACHSPTGAGNALAGFPKLGGQHAKYTVAQLKAFRRAAQFSDDEIKALRAKGEAIDAGRRNDGTDQDSAMMRTVAAKLTDREIEAVANYIAGLH